MPAKKLNPITTFALEGVEKLRENARRFRQLSRDLEKLAEERRQTEQDLTGSMSTLFNASQAGYIPAEEYEVLKEAWERFHAEQNAPLPEPEKPQEIRTLLDILDEITAAMEGEFRSEDVREPLGKHSSALKRQPHRASITSTLNRLVELEKLKKTSEGGRGKEATYRRVMEEEPKT